MNIAVTGRRAQHQHRPENGRMIPNPQGGPVRSDFRGGRDPGSHLQTLHAGALQARHALMGGRRKQFCGGLHSWARCWNNNKECAVSREFKSQSSGRVRKHGLQCGEEPFCSGTLSEHVAQEGGGKPCKISAPILRHCHGHLKFQRPPVLPDYSHRTKALQHKRMKTFDE